ncbi:hypothetical protein D3C74_407610 [compost metagenome]
MLRCGLNPRTCVSTTLMMSPTSHHFRFSCNMPLSSRTIPNRFVTRRFIRKAPSRMLPVNSLRSSGVKRVSFSNNPVAEPIMAVRGVRNSWETESSSAVRIRSDSAVICANRASSASFTRAMALAASPPHASNRRSCSCCS